MKGRGDAGEGPAPLSVQHVVVAWPAAEASGHASAAAAAAVTVAVVGDCPGHALAVASASAVGAAADAALSAASAGRSQPDSSALAASRIDATGQQEFLVTGLLLGAARCLIPGRIDDCVNL